MYVFYTNTIKHSDAASVVTGKQDGGESCVKAAQCREHQQR